MNGRETMGQLAQRVRASLHKYRLVWLVILVGLFLPLLPTGGGFALIYALAEGMLSASSSIVPALAQLAWIVVSLVAFIIVAPRIPCDE